MKTTFYYFTGTGNSLYGAEKIAKNFDETEIIPIAGVLKSGEEIKFPKGASGIVCPVYLAGIPLIVSEFITKADLSLPDYIFIVLRGCCTNEFYWPIRAIRYTSTISKGRICVVL